MPFSVSQNVSALFKNISKGASANLYYDGAMLANNDEWFLYGGLITGTDTIAADAADVVWEYQVDAYGIDETAFSPGFKTYEVDRDGGNVTSRYIAYGGAANVPSENLAFYFSGLRSSTWGSISRFTADLASTANTLISLDFGTQNQEVFTNYTLPDNVSGRAGPELVWVPVGEQGILVALGGVIDPAFSTSVNATASVSLIFKHARICFELTLFITA